MALAISVRLDADAERALRMLEASGLSRSDAIRGALIDAAKQMHSRAVLQAEVKALASDTADRAEMQEIANLMEALRAPR